MRNTSKNKLNLKFHYGGSETTNETVVETTTTDETATTNETIIETPIQTTNETIVETPIESSDDIVEEKNSLKDNIFYKLYNNVDNNFTTTLQNFVPSSLWLKLLLTAIISGILIFIFNKISNWVNGTTTLLYDNCRLTDKGPRCNFSGSKKIEGDEGIYLIKTSYDNNIPITNDISFYIYLNKYNKISLVTDLEVILNQNLLNDYKKKDKLIFLFNKGLKIYLTPENEKLKEVLVEINTSLNEILLDLDKLKFKSDNYKKVVNDYRELLFKMKETIGYPGRDIKKQLKNTLQKNKFGGNRVYDEVINDSPFYKEIIKEDLGFGTEDNFEYKTSVTQAEYDRISEKAEKGNISLKNKIKNSLKNFNTLTKTDDKSEKVVYNKYFNKNFISDSWNKVKNIKFGGKMKGGKIYDYSIKFKESIGIMIEDFNVFSREKPQFNSKRLQWIVDSYRDKFVIKSKYNPNITLLYPETRFSIRRFYGDKKLYDRKLDSKNMFKSFKNLSIFVNTLRKKVLNIRDNYNSYYKIYYEDKSGKKYLQVNNSNNNYIEMTDKCSKLPGNIIYTGDNYKLCNPFVLKLLCENDRNCKSIVQSHNPNSCSLTDDENIGGDESTLKYCESNTLFKQNIENGYRKKNNFSDIVKFDVLKNTGISNWQLIKVDEL